jgi:ATP-binding cassette, subfamily B (MDR/TAP), member 1
VCHGSDILVSRRTDGVLKTTTLLTLPRYGGQLLASREYNILQFYLIYIAIIQGAQGAGPFMSYAPNIARATQAANRILDSRAYGDSGRTALTTVPVPLPQKASKTGAKIELKDVVFKYPTRDAPIYRNLSLTIQSGQFVAFVGPSGCGKTTVVSLLERFYDPTSGTITFDDQNLNEIDITSYRRALSLVAQEPRLFDGTIRENLVLGIDDEDITETQIIEACKDAEIHDFIVSLPDGYDTNLGINTQTSLSGGQKQRLCLARALLRSPSLLLLDEATSSLDSQSERLVQAAIEKLVAVRSMTVVAVAHRLATIQKADVIFVFGESEVGRGSKILERGTHSELLRRRGAYWAMCQEQALDR